MQLVKSYPALEITFAMAEDAGLAVPGALTLTLDQDFHDGGQSGVGGISFLLMA